MKSVTSVVLAVVLAEEATAFAGFATSSHSAPSATALMAYRQSYQHQLDVITGHVPKNGVTVKPSAAPSAPVNGGSYTDGLEVTGSIPPIIKEKDVHLVEQKTVEPAPALDVDKDEVMFENFIMKRELSRGEALSLVERILLRETEEVVRREFISEGGSQVETTVKHYASIATDAEGKFTLDEKHYQIGYAPGVFGTMKALWKDGPGIKIEQDQFGTRSVKYWFEQVGLEPRYIANAKAVVREMFAKEL